MFPTRLHVRQMNANGTAPNDLFSWNNNTMKHNSYNGYITLLLTDAQWHLLCAWSFLEAVVEPSSSFSAISLPLLSSPVQTQLMLIVLHFWGPGAPHPQNGVPSPRVHAHSHPRVQNSEDVNILALELRNEEDPDILPYTNRQGSKDHSKTMFPPPAQKIMFFYLPRYAKLDFSHTSLPIIHF